MSFDQVKIPVASDDPRDPQTLYEERMRQADEEWEALDAAAEESEQQVLEEIAAARVARAKMDATAKTRQEAIEAHEAEEAEKAAHAAKMIAADEDLTEEEVLHRRAVVAAQDGVQLRRSMTMSLFFTALGALEAYFGLSRGNFFLGVLGIAIAVVFLGMAVVTRKRYKTALDHFNVLNAELEEYRTVNGSTLSKVEEK